MKHSFALLLPLAFACGVANAAAANAESDRAQIAALEQRWLAAIRGGDRQALGEILAKGFVDINTDGKMRERDEAIAHASAPPDTTQTIRQLKVRVFGDTAVANLHYCEWIRGWTDTCLQIYGELAVRNPDFLARFDRDEAKAEAVL